MPATGPGPAPPRPPALPLCDPSYCSCPACGQRTPSSPHHVSPAESELRREHLTGQTSVTCFREAGTGLLALPASEVGGGLNPQPRFTRGGIPQTRRGSAAGPTPSLPQPRDSPGASMFGPLSCPPKLIQAGSWEPPQPKSRPLPGQRVQPMGFCCGSQLTGHSPCGSRPLCC